MRVFTVCVALSLLSLSLSLPLSISGATAKITQLNKLTSSSTPSASSAATILISDPFSPPTPTTNIVDENDDDDDDDDDVLLPLVPLTVPSNSSDHTLPDPTMTPGAAFVVDTPTVCTPGYSSKVRHVTAAEKKKVYAEYGVLDHQGYCNCTEGCEVDHLISLEIGGSNDITNLWPEPYCGTNNAHVKDQLENKLHTLMCAGTIDMQTAQTAISTNWIVAYNKYVASGDY